MPPAGLVVVADHQTAGRGRLGRTLGGAARVRRCWSRCCCARTRAPERARRRDDGGRAARWPRRSSDVAGVARRAEVAERPRGRRPQARRAPRRGRRRGRRGAGGGDRRGVQPRLPTRIPTELAASATACDLEGGRPVDRDALLAAFLDGARRRASATSARVPDDVPRPLGTLGRRVRVELGAGGADGRSRRSRRRRRRALVRDDDGTESAVAAGDVVHLATPAADGCDVAADELRERVGEPRGERAGRDGQRGAVDASRSPAPRGCSTRGTPRRPRSSASSGSAASSHGMPSVAHSSSTSARVTPSRQPASAGRRVHHTVLDDEDVRPGGLAQLAARVRRTSPRPRRARARTRARARSRRTRSSSARRSRRARCGSTAR